LAEKETSGMRAGLGKERRKKKEQKERTKKVEEE
jgi:hypothetical protein